MYIYIYIYYVYVNEILNFTKNSITINKNLYLKISVHHPHAFHVIAHSVKWNSYSQHVYQREFYAEYHNQTALLPRRKRRIINVTILHWTVTQVDSLYEYHVIFVQWIYDIGMVHPTCKEPCMSNIPHTIDNVCVQYIYLPSFNN